MAIIVGAYEGILNAISGIFNRFRITINYIFPISLGVLSAMIALSIPLNYFCNSFPTLSKYIFCSITLISSTVFIKNNVRFSFTYPKAMCLFIGIASALLLSVVTNKYPSIFHPNGVLPLIFIGLILSIALILPAVSFSYFMLYFGIYNDTLNAISSFDLIYLCSLFAGIAIGGFIFSKLLSWILLHYRENTYSFTLGFVLYSIVEILK